MAFLFDRSVEVLIGNPKREREFDFSESKVDFEIIKGETEIYSENICSIRVWNLSSESRRKLMKKKLVYTIKAGYLGVGINSILSQGRIKTIDDSYLGSSKNNYVSITGTEGPDLKTIPFSKSYSPNTSKYTVFTDLMGTLKKESNLKKFFFKIPFLNRKVERDLRKARFRHGHTADGSVSKQINSILTDVAFTRGGRLIFNIDNGKTYVRNKYFPISEKDRAILTYESGLISARENKGRDLETNEVTDGLVIECLINPLIRVGYAVVLRGTKNKVDGNYIVKSLTITGSNYSGDYRMKIISDRYNKKKKKEINQVTRGSAS